MYRQPQEEVDLYVCLVTPLVQNRSARFPCVVRWGGATRNRCCCLCCLQHVPKATIPKSQHAAVQTRPLMWRVSSGSQRMICVEHTHLPCIDSFVLCGDEDALAVDTYSISHQQMCNV